MQPTQYSADTDAFVPRALLACENFISQNRNDSKPSRKNTATLCRHFSVRIIWRVSGELHARQTMDDYDYLRLRGSGEIASWCMAWATFQHNDIQAKTQTGKVGCDLAQDAMTLLRCGRGDHSATRFPYKRRRACEYSQARLLL